MVGFDQPIAFASFVECKSAGKTGPIARHAFVMKSGRGDHRAFRRQGKRLTRGGRETYPIGENLPRLIAGSEVASGAC